mgnify:CR=1 FL=1
MKEPMTEDLLNELLDSPDPAAFASKHKLACRSLPDYLQQLLDERGLRRPEVVRQAGINPRSGIRSSSPAQSFTQQAIAAGLRYEAVAARDEPSAAGRRCNELYCKNRRDAIIIFCINHGETLQTADEQLYAFHEDTITE